MADTLNPARPPREREPVDFHTLRLERARLRHHLAIPFVLSSGLVVVTTIVTAIGVFNPGIFRDPAMTAGNARGTALVMLVVAVPLLAGSLVLTARGSARAGLVWIGSLGYLLYNSVLFCFAMAFNRLFLLNVAMFALALWSVVAVMTRVDPSVLRERFRETTPVRLIAGYVIVTALLTYLAWLRDIVPALVDNTVPSSLERTVMLTNPIEVMDLSISLPLMILAGVWLWQRKPWGYLLSGVLTVMFTMETLGIAVDQVFGHRNDPEQSLAAVPLMLGLTVIGLFVSYVYLRNVREDPVEYRSQKR